MAGTDEMGKTEVGGLVGGMFARGSQFVAVGCHGVNKSNEKVVCLFSTTLCFGLVGESFQISISKREMK